MGVHLVGRQSIGAVQNREPSGGGDANGIGDQGVRRRGRRGVPAGGRRSRAGTAPAAQPIKVVRALDAKRASRSGGDPDAILRIESDPHQGRENAGKLKRTKAARASAWELAGMPYRSPGEQQIIVARGVVFQRRQRSCGRPSAAP